MTIIQVGNHSGRDKRASSRECKKRSRSCYIEKDELREGAGGQGAGSDHADASHTARGRQSLRVPGEGCSPGLSDGCETGPWMG